MEAEKSYCLCGLPYDPNVFMIQCDICKDWFHSSCTKFQEQTAPEIDKYHCPKCGLLHGPSQFKSYQNYHRHDYWDSNALGKPVQTGTAVFIKELQARHFHSDNEIVTHVKGHMLDESYLLQNGFNVPIVVNSNEGLQMKVPPPEFTLYDVERYVGGEHEMDVIDVVRQLDLRMSLKDFVAYYYSPHRIKVYNVVSLEFSKMGLTNLVDAPHIVRQLDWANSIWPKEYAEHQLHVQKYCLMSVKDSYTDFHIDFGGTSVWYHVLRGQKIFYLIKPTPANLTLYQQWMTSTNQSETFFGDQADQCFKCVLSAGQTMLIPTGWIHAVFTPEDSLVFGGNFLHSLNIPKQLQVYDIEKKIKMDPKFLYPLFETMHWFTAQKMLLEIHKINVEAKKCPENLLTGLKTLLTYLKTWNAEVHVNISSKEQIPKGISVSKLFKDIAKEIRISERYLNSLNPPKPERESKRQRKRPVKEDFVDFPFQRNLFTNNKSESPARPKKSPMKQAVKTTPSSSNSNRNSPSQVPNAWPGTATAVHRGGTVLKIKLGTNEVIPVGNLNTESKPLEDMNVHKSIYDFRDEDSVDESLQLFIDEGCSPKKSINWCMKLDDVEDRSNGIESLLKASALTTKLIHRNEQGRTSPSTQEAIAGMLSISQRFVQPKSSKHRKKSSESTLLDEEELNHVHQDDDYIYPAIEHPNEEIYKAKGRGSVDESWCPGVRVGPLLPKVNRPAREGTRKAAVEKVLEAAAKRSNLSFNESPKRSSSKKRTKPKPPKQLEEKIESPVINSVLPGPSNPPGVNCSTPSSRSKKGMKTVKQRLGKILKIHKMMH